MSDYFLAVDIGASSGRHILGRIIDGKMVLEEVHRFENGMELKNGRLCWNYDRLFEEIKLGMKKCQDMGKTPVSMGIDTWGVDFVLLDGDDQVVGDTVAYRDSRTTGMDEKVYEKIDEKSLYGRTGIQKQLFNTIYQLMAIKEQNPEHMEKAKCMLLVPDYFHFLLSGVKKNEYTNATTGQLVSPDTKNWDWELIDTLGYNRTIFGEIIKPGTVLGGLLPEIQEEVGFDCKVIVPPTHDTASAVIAVPALEDDVLYISSGTWSLMGVERMEADCSEKSAELNFTNEGGYDYRFRYLKNIMGLWMIQSAKKEFQEDYSFARLCEMASKTEIKSIVPCNDSRFIAPESMIDEVKAACEESGQQVPKSPAETAAVIYRSLASCYNDTALELEEMTGIAFGHIHIVGGGANAAYLNELTAQFTGKEVLAGPTEATAIGNLESQMIAGGIFDDMFQARKCIRASFEMKCYAGEKVSS